MGDKTQILAMMFATKYKTGKVLLGILIGSALNHGLAVAFGSLLGQFIPIWILQIVAGFAFVGFALWTLMGDEEEDEEDEGYTGKKTQSAVIVVAMAFFLGELGDKTQLTAITLSVATAYPVFVLLGTVSGMIVTSSIGILVGSKIGDRLPEALIKVVSSGIFLTFGVLKLIGSTPDAYINIYTVTVFSAVILFAVILLFRSTLEAHREGRLTPYVRAARTLYDYAHQVEKAVDDICLGAAHCGQCSGEACAIGFMRHLAKELKENDYNHDHEAMAADIKHYKDKFSRSKLVHTLKMNMRYLATLDEGSAGYTEVDMIRRIIEIMLFEKNLPYSGDLNMYSSEVSALDPSIKIQ